jgi:hypothetical protein
VTLAPPRPVTVTDLLHPRHDPGRPYHVYQLDGGDYRVRRHPDGVPFPDFWWTFPGRILQATILPVTYAGHHVVVTFFQFNAERHEVFETVHLDGTAWTVMARTGCPGDAASAHQSACGQLQETLALADDPDPLPSWL